MPQAESGYATVLVVGLMSAISLIAINIMGLATTQAKKNSALQRQIELDIQLESALNTLISDILNHKIKFDKSSKLVSLSLGSKQYSALVEFETGKSNINTMEISDIENSLRSHVSNANLLSRITNSVREIRLSTQKRVKAFSDIMPSTENASKIKYCLRNHYTLYSSNAPFNFNPRQGTISDGAIARFIVASNDPQTKRSLDTTILFTGIKSDPFWILDWERSPKLVQESCQDEL